jgi:Lysozyme inhibitor LprI
MSGKISAIVLTLLWLHSPIVFGQAHFKRFPETVTNNGAYVLGWGIKDDPAGSVDLKTEIVAAGPEQLDLYSDRFEPYERVEDYLVDTATGKIVATIPDFTYYAGSEGRENHFDLEVGWSPDNRGGIAIYQARYATDKVAWINPTEHKTTNVWPQIEKAVRRVAVRKKGKEAADADYEISVSNPVFVRPRRVVMDAVIGALSSKKLNAPSYRFEILFDVKGNFDAPQLELASTKSVSDESGRDIGDNEIEARLNKAYHKLAAALPPHDRESLKQEQLKWLATREHITAAETDKKEFIQLQLTRRRVAELETCARYR